jgi:ArsR family transcriptional regulator
MKEGENIDGETPGDLLVQQLAALASPHRLAILACLDAGHVHVSQLAREVGLSRPLVHMHLKKLEAAGLIRGSLELSDDGKALRYFDLAQFDIHLTPHTVADAARTVTRQPQPPTKDLSP